MSIENDIQNHQISLNLEVKHTKAMGPSTTGSNVIVIDDNLDPKIEC